MVLRYVARFFLRKGYSCSVREIQSNFGWMSPTAAVRHLEELQRKGYIQRVPRIARSITITESGWQIANVE